MLHSIRIHVQNRTKLQMMNKMVRHGRNVTIADLLQQLSAMMCHYTPTFTKVGKTKWINFNSKKSITASDICSPHQIELPYFYHIKPNEPLPPIKIWFSVQYRMPAGDTHHKSKSLDLYFCWLTSHQLDTPHTIAQYHDSTFQHSSPQTKEKIQEKGHDGTKTA